MSFKNFNSDVRIKFTTSNKWVKYVTVKQVVAYALFENVKKAMKNLVKADSETLEITSNVAFSENEYNKYCTLCNTQGFSVEVLEFDDALQVAKKIKTFVKSAEI